ncbi:MAG: hypothetical protein ABI591_29280 [Kofleriaceae bacterium]
MKYLWLLVLAACTTFDPVARGVCGNGIVEDGEDCDSSDATCIACAVVCASGSDCPNTAYTCGTDQRCHAPGGTLGQGAVAGSFAANDYRITDIDQDGIGDVVGTSRSSIVVRHGAASGQLDVLDSSLTPTQTGPASYGNLDGDASLDIAIATPDGMVAYTSPYGTLSPLDVDNLIADPTAGYTLDVRDLFTVTHEAIGGFVVDDSPGPSHDKIAYTVFDFVNLNTPTAGLPCGLVIDQTEFSTANVEVYQVNADGTTPTDIVVALIVGTAAQKKLCVLAVHKDSVANLSNVTDITPSNAPTYTTKPVLADLSVDSDHCPSLIDVDGGPGALKRYDGLLLGGHCTFKAAVAGGIVTPAVPVTTPSAKIIGRVPTVPSFVGLSSDTLVTSDGLYLFGGASWQQVYQAARPWSHVGFADLDKDGSVDLVLSGEGADDLDILYRKSFLTYPVYQLLRLDTAAEVTSIIIDDFDGNSWLDIAFTEKLANHTELDVAYGTSDRPLDPIEVGVFSNLIAFAKIGLPDSADPLDVIDDLIVLTPGEPVAGLTFLHGSAQRTLLPYFDPRTSKPPANYGANTIFRSTVIGSFVPTIGGGADHPDLIGIAVPKSTGTPAGADARAWIAAGNGATLDGTASDGAKLAGLAACGLGTANTGCVEEASFFPWRVAAGHDVVFSIDHAKSPTASVFDPNAIDATVLTATKATGFAPIPADAVIRALHAADLDGDGALELIAAFAPSDTTTPGAVLVCEVDGTGQTHDCSDVVATTILPLSATASCFDAAPGHFTARDRFATAAATTDLIIACHDTATVGSTLYRVTSTGGTYTATELLHTTLALGSIQVGDVTGDGIDDVVALEGASGTESLVVFAQCSSRNASSCTGESR